MLQTYVVRTHSGLEAFASKELGNQGFETFLPLAKTSSRTKKGKIVERVRPLFSSYLFVLFNAKVQRWRSIASTRGVHSFIGWVDGMEAPLYVREHEMAALRAMVAEGDGFVQFQSELPIHLKPETMVRILFGTFEGFTAKVKEDQGSKVEAFLSLFGRETKVTLPRESLVLAA